jgi:tellurite resistance protein TehA-like permease
MTSDDQTQRYSVWRRPLWLVVVIGCMVSATASGRFSVRLIADGAVSFAFIPVFQVAALYVVCRTGIRARLPFAEAVDRFFAGNTAWLIWLTVVAAAFAVVPPREIDRLMKPAMFSSVVPLVVSALADFLLFRDTMERDVRGAWRDVALQRALGLGAGLTYFFGIAVWHEYVPQLRGWFGL